MNDVRLTDWPEASLFEISLLMELLNPSDYDTDCTRKDGLPLTPLEALCLKNSQELNHYLLVHGFDNSKKYNALQVLEWIRQNLQQTDYKPGLIIVNDAARNRFFPRYMDHARLKPAYSHTITTNETISKLERQIQAIIATAKEMGFDSMNIPESGKQKIKIECLEDRTLFTDSTFDSAWKKGSASRRISIENKEKFLKNQ